MRHATWGSISLALALAAAPAIEARAQDTQELRAKAMSAFQAKKWDEAAAAFKKITEQQPDDVTAWQNLGYCLHLSGRLDEALPVHMKAAEFPQAKPVATYNVACVYALKKDKEKAFEWLQKAVDAGFSDANQLTSDDDLASLRSDPRFDALATKMKSMPEVQQPFVTTTKRASTRAAYFGRRGSAGQIVIDYGTPPWKDTYAAAVESATFAGQRWRLGQDFWTNIDANVDLIVGGVPVKAGYYYLTLEKGEGDKGVLQFHDPAVIHAKKLDASGAIGYKGAPAFEVPITVEKGTDLAKELEFRVAIGSSDAPKGLLTIRFGPYKATTPIELVIAKSSS
jgi:tetratricopeptide (TPR) repeat protein